MRSFKLDEFVAHGSTVNCLRIGRNTAGVLATGGDDKKVNLWRIGQPHVAKSLSGLQSPVECVTFDSTENFVAAGGANGTVKVWDLESGKVDRSLTGHRSNCLTVDFYPFEPKLLVTGSLDTNVKVWDLRRKDCINTFKGHSKGIKKLAISPDGKWVCSGSENGEIKLWDMQTGRVVKDGWSHDNSITGIEFHPSEFVLATSGMDRVVRLWDLETWELMDTLGPEATAIRAIAYYKDGKQLLAATADALKVWGCEPTVHHDTVPMDWRQLADMHLSYKDDQPRVIGCCCSMSAVGVFLVDLRKVAPFSQSGGWHQQDQAPAMSIGSGPHSKLSQCRQLTDASASASATDIYRQQELASSTHLNAPSINDSSHAGVYAACTNTGESVTTTGKDSEAATSQAAAAGPMTRQLCRQRTPRAHLAAAEVPSDRQQLSNSTGRSKQGSFSGSNRREAMYQQLQPGQLQPSSDHLLQPQQLQARCKGSGGTFPDFEIRVSPALPPLPKEQPAVGSSSSNNSLTVNRPPLSMPPAPGSEVSSKTSSKTGSKTSSAVTSRQSSQTLDATSAVPRQLSMEGPSVPSYAAHTHSSSSKMSPRGARLSEPPIDVMSSSSAAVCKAANNGPAKSPSKNSRDTSPLHSAAAAPSAADAGIYISNKLPAHHVAAAADPITAAMAKQPTLIADLSRMAAALQVVKGFVTRGNLEGAFKSTLSQNDAAIASMLVEALQGRQDAFELNSLESLLSLLELLLASGAEQQQAVGLSALSLVLRGPGQLVKDVCSAPTPAGVDLSYENRKNKCVLVKMVLQGLGMKVGVLARGAGALAARAQLVAEELKQVVD